MQSPTLTYLMVTRNKLSFLRHTLPRLLSNLQEDEEIVAIDGASTDGTTEYLQDLYASGKIHQFLSERDYGDSHGANKGLLMARGELVKEISDDDVYHYPTIQLCKEYMLANPDVDVLFSDAGHSRYGWTEPGGLWQYGPEFDRWAREGRPFSFSGPGIMLRKRSLPLIGLYLTTVKATDVEYTLRITSLPVCLAWCSRLSFIHFLNPASGAIRYYHLLQEEYARFKKFYNCEDPPLPLHQRLISTVKSFLRPIKRILVPVPTSAPSPMLLKGQSISEELVGASIENHTAWLDKKNQSLPLLLKKSVRGSLCAK